MTQATALGDLEDVMLYSELTRHQRANITGFRLYGELRCVKFTVTVSRMVAPGARGGRNRELFLMGFSLGK